LVLAKKLEELEPYGMGNPQISFLSDAKVLEVKTFGKDKNHMKLYMTGPVQKWYPLEFISFNGVEKWTDIVPGKNVEIMYQLEIDRWGGNERLRGKLIHMQLA
jgi:single-stranded DNA-specific DHH superfamily exonuclease